MQIKQYMLLACAMASFTHNTIWSTPAEEKALENAIANPIMEAVITEVTNQILGPDNLLSYLINVYTTLNRNAITYTYITKEDEGLPDAFLACIWSLLVTNTHISYWKNQAYKLKERKHTVNQKIRRLEKDLTMFADTLPFNYVDALNNIEECKKEKSDLEDDIAYYEAAVHNYPTCIQNITHFLGLISSA